MKNNNNPFYKTADSLLRMKVKSMEDVKNFYVGINNLAAQISSNQAFVTELGSLKYSDNIKLHEGVNYILGYGQAIEKSKIFPQLPLRKISLKSFLKNNPRVKSRIKIVQKEARLYFHSLKNAFEEYKAENDKKNEKYRAETYKEINELKKAVERLEKERIISPEEKEFSIGPLKYKDYRITYNEKPLKLTPQLVKLCKLFIERSQKTDSFVSDHAIREVITVKDHISLENIEKSVSKLRRILKKENRHLEIKRRGGEGYTFIAENIR